MASIDGWKGDLMRVVSVLDWADSLVPLLAVVPDESVLEHLAFQALLRDRAHHRSAIRTTLKALQRMRCHVDLGSVVLGTAASVVKPLLQLLLEQP